MADRVAEGSDYIKIVIGSPGADHDQATVDALVAAAHQHGKRAVAHASSFAAVAKAQHAGVDVLTHVPLDRALDEAAAEQMAADGRILIPTLTMMETLVARLGRPGDGYAAARDSVTAAYRAGVPILAGTDANADSPAAVSFGDSLHHELELLVAAGLSGPDALRAATELPARYFGLGDRGAVGPGRRADLVLLGRGPAPRHPGDPVDPPYLVRRDRACSTDSRMRRSHEPARTAVGHHRRAQSRRDRRLLRRLRAYSRG